MTYLLHLFCDYSGMIFCYRHFSLNPFLCVTSLEVNGKPVNMDHLHVEVLQRYNSASEFLSVLNFVAYVSVCASRKSPSCTITSLGLLASLGVPFL